MAIVRRVIVEFIDICAHLKSRGGKILDRRDNIFRLMLHFLISVFLLLSNPSHANDDKDPVWFESGDADGIFTYYRRIKGSPVYALKGTGNVDAPLWKVASVLLDSKRGTEWVDSLAATKMLRRISPFSYIEFNHIKTPFVLKDREFVTEMNIEINKDKKSFEMTYHPAPLETAPETSNVRGEIVYGKLTVTSLVPGKTCYIEGELHCDPKGSIPKWIVNLFQKGWPRRTLEGVRKQAAKTDITLPEEFKEILLPTVSF